MSKQHTATQKHIAGRLDKPDTHILKSVKTTPSTAFVFVPDQTHRKEDDLESNCVTRKSSDATPGNFKKKRIVGLQTRENQQKSALNLQPATLAHHLRKRAHAALDMDRIVNRGPDEENSGVKFEGTIFVRTEKKHVQDVQTLT